MLHETCLGEEFYETNNPTNSVIQSYGGKKVDYSTITTFRNHIRPSPAHSKHKNPFAKRVLEYLMFMARE